MDATQLLKNDHDAVRRLFEAFRNAGEDEVSKRELFDQIREEVLVHAKVEEELFYPAVRQIRADGDDAEDMIDEAKEEHEEVEELLEEIAALEPSDKAFDRKVKKLEKAIEHHAGEEEDEMFPFARENLGADRLLSLGGEILARKQQLSPRSPHNPVQL